MGMGITRPSLLRLSRSEGRPQSRHRDRALYPGVTDTICLPLLRAVLSETPDNPTPYFPGLVRLSDGSVLVYAFRLHENRTILREGDHLVGMLRTTARSRGVLVWNA